MCFIDKKQTVKSLQNDHHLVQINMVFVDRWSLFAVHFLYKLDCLSTKKRSWVTGGRYSRWSLSPGSTVHTKCTQMTLKLTHGRTRNCSGIEVLVVRGRQLATSDPGDTPKANPSLVVQLHHALSPNSIQLLGRNYRAFNLKMSHCAKSQDSDSFR